MHQLAGRISLIPVNKREYFIHRVRYVNVTERGVQIQRLLSNVVFKF